MSKLYRLLQVLSLCVSPVCGFCDFALLDCDYGIGYSYRQDQLEFEMEQKSGSFKDEIKQSFDDVQIHQISGMVNFKTYSHVYFRAIGSYGWVFDGETESSEELMSLALKHKGCVDDCCVFDFSASVGSEIDCGSDCFKFIPLFGYSWDRQRFKTNSITVEIDNINGFDSGICLSGLKHEYKASWYGPWVGVNMIFEGYCNLDTFAGFEYHWATFSADYYRNEVTINNILVDKSDREDHGCGDGFVATGGIKGKFCGEYFWSLSGNYQYWKVKHGLMKEYDGDLFDLKCVEWRSWQLTAAVGLSF